MADDVQPDDSGQGETGAGLYDSYLQFVPQDQHQAALAHLKEVSSGVESKLREAADLRAAYEPLQQSGYGPQEISQLVNWHQEVTSSEEKYREFIAQESKAAGLIPEAERTPEQDALADLSPKQIEEQVQALIAPLEERINNDQQAALVDKERNLLLERRAAFESEHKMKLTEDAWDWILATAAAKDNDEGHMLAYGHDWLTPGFETYLQIRADAQKEFVDGKAKQPAPAISAGGVAAIDQSTSWADVREQARERMRQART